MTPDDLPQISRLRHTLHRWSDSDRGAHAAIRRAEPGDLATPALWKLFATCDLDPPSDDAARPWALTAWALATLGEADSRASLGQAMHAAGISELRLVRLLRADPAQLPDALRAVVRQLLAKGLNADAVQLLRLVQTDPASDAGERARMVVARDYYRAERAAR